MFVEMTFSSVLTGSDANVGVLDSQVHQHMLTVRLLASFTSMEATHEGFTKCIISLQQSDSFWLLTSREEEEKEVDEGLVVSGSHAETFHPGEGGDEETEPKYESAWPEPTRS